MNLEKLNEMPELKSGDRPNDGEYRLCLAYNHITRTNVQWITARSNAVDLDARLEIFTDGKDYFCCDKHKNKVVSILTAPMSNRIKGYLPGVVIHEESIDTCTEYRGKGITTNFYYSLIKAKLCILSDHKHYIGTQRLWKSLSKKIGITIRVYKKYELVADDYDLIKDELGVWTSNQYLLLASLKSLVESLKLFDIGDK
jgi:hypothetical protein